MNKLLRMQTGFIVFSTLIICLTMSACSEPSGHITLSNDTLRVTVDPSTLNVIAYPKEKPPISLSEPQEISGLAHNIIATNNSVRWELPEKHITAKMSLSDTELTVLFESDQPGAFTWPVMDLQDPVKALIWPYWEGRYIPLDDSQWQNFLCSNEWNTLEGFCMPFWGYHCSDSTVTYIITNSFNNSIQFQPENEHLKASFTHEFPKSKNDWQYGFVIRITDNLSPIEPAKEYRQWLIQNNQHVPMSAKIKQIPKAAWLLGAPHMYLWGADLLCHHDIRRPQWQNFCKELIGQAKADSPSAGKRIQSLMAPDQWTKVEVIADMEWPDQYNKREVCTGLSQLLKQRDFYEAASWENVRLPDEAKTLLARDRSSLSTAEVCRMNGLLLEAAYPDVFLPIDRWGNGVSLKMLEQLKEAGLKRARLCLDGWEGIENRPDIVKQADKMGYLFGIYDSFHSIHDPALKGTDESWTTAQFDQKLYDTGGILRADGTLLKGFMKRGCLLSPHAARPYVEARVKANMSKVPYNYYFIDCDAFGQVFDDYSPLHPSTQEQDAAERADRMAWISNTFGAVIGSEGGCSYFAPVIHVAEGMLSPGFGWGDPDMKNRDSEYYLGGYYPPDGPQVYLKETRIKDKYLYTHYDPRFRLPLYETVFHDSVVSTHCWGNPSLKFSNIVDTVSLIEMLYLCPPMYHMNLDSLKTQRDRIIRHNDFFYPIHSEFGFAPLTDFEWLTPDRLVQRTMFDGKLEMIANFSTEPYTTGGTVIPPRCVRANYLETGTIRLFPAQE